jgi:hypothetical protein
MPAPRCGQLRGTIREERDRMAGHLSQMDEFPEPFAHTDSNTLRKVG